VHYPGARMAAARLRDVFPAVYERLLPAFFDGPAISEPRATCDNCAMCDQGTNPSAVAAEFFRPDVKCCSFWPTLPNYLVGAALDDPRPEAAEGANRLRAVIAKRIGVTAAWVAAPRKYLVLLDAARVSSFGRSSSLLCPYYAKDTGLCTVWQHREAVCATFFCKYAAGGSGHKLWTALKQWFSHVERSLATHAARELVPGYVEPLGPGRGKLTIEDLEERPVSPDAYAQAFGPWAGREQELYVASYELVRALSPDGFARIVGPKADELLRTATARYEAVTAPKLARKLRLNPDMPTTRGPGGVGVTPYSRYDSFFLLDAVYDALAEFGPDETVDVTLERLARERDIELPRELLLEMQLFELMIPIE
jgi:Fe-S-cluster containining protein